MKILPLFLLATTARAALTGAVTLCLLAPALYLLVAPALCLLVVAPAADAVGPPPAGGTIAARDLPPEAREVIARIHTNGPFAFKRDGITFGNFEKRLPIQPRGYYREYTVPTPGEHTRGARRIIAGRDGELFYTADHYETFRRIIQ